MAVQWIPACASMTGISTTRIKPGVVCPRLPMATHPLLSKPHAQRIASLWGKLKISEDEYSISTEEWKKLLKEATPQDLGHYGFSLMMTLGLSVSGGINLRDDKSAEPLNHQLIRCATVEVFATKKAEFTPEQLVEILRSIDGLPSHWCHSQLSYGWLVVGGLKPHFSAQRKVTPELILCMRQLRKNMSHQDGGYEKYVSLIEKLLGDDQVEPPILWRSDAWMTTYCDLQDDFTEIQKSNWDAIMKISFAAKGSKPAKKFQKSIDAAIGQLGETEFVRVMSKILDSIGDEGPLRQFGFMGCMDNDMTRLDRDFTNLLRALVWATAEIPELTDSIGNAANACFEPVANTGARCSKVGAACVRSLNAYGSEQALELIEQMQASAEKKSVRKAIERALEN